MMTEPVVNKPFDAWANVSNRVIQRYHTVVTEHARRLGSPEVLFQDLMEVATFYVEGMTDNRWDLKDAVAHLNATYDAINRLNGNGIVFSPIAFTTLTFGYRDAMIRDRNRDAIQALVDLGEEARSDIDYSQFENDERAMYEHVDPLAGFIIHKPKVDPIELYVAAHVAQIVDSDGDEFTPMDEQHRQSYTYFADILEKQRDEDDRDKYAAMHLMVQRINQCRGNLPELVELIRWGSSNDNHEDPWNTYIRPFRQFSHLMEFPSGQADFIAAHYMAFMGEEAEILETLNSRLDEGVNLP